MTHREHMTRAAARAISKDLTGFVWNDEALGLVRGNYPINVWPSEFFPEVFAPLHNPADAFSIESDLQLNVEYKANGQQMMIVVSRVEGEAQTTYMTGFPIKGGREVALKARMLAVTQFAAMCDAVMGESPCPTIS